MDLTLPSKDIDCQIVSKKQNPIIHCFQEIQLTTKDKQTKNKKVGKRFTRHAETENKQE
jgi:hypothetical protein